MNREQKALWRRTLDCDLAERVAQIGLAGAQVRWARSVGMATFPVAIIYAAWDAVIRAHGEGGTPQEIAARIDAIVRSYGGTPQGAAPDDSGDDAERGEQEHAEALGTDLAAERADALDRAAIRAEWCADYGGDAEREPWPPVDDRPEHAPQPDGEGGEP